MRLSLESTLNELAKLGAISDDEARRAADRIDQLEKNRLTPKAVARGAAFGALAGPAVHGIGNLVKGKKFEGVRDIASHAAKGALGGGVIPLLQSGMQSKGEEKTLRTYLSEQGVK